MPIDASPIKRVTSVTGALKTQALVLGGTLAVFWAVFVVNSLLGGSLLRLGVIPRTTVGLRGILFAPFLHGSLNHIVANSFPFLALGWMVMLRDERHFIPVTIAGVVGSGLMAWLLGAPGTVESGGTPAVEGRANFPNDMIGAYRETATLTLDEFRKRGMVELGRRSIELLDRRALEQLAEP